MSTIPTRKSTSTSRDLRTKLASSGVSSSQNAARAIARSAAAFATQSTAAELTVTAEQLF